MVDSHILMIVCEDGKGLVHLITGVLYRASLNIVVNHEFVDKDSKMFFMRTEFSGIFDRNDLMLELKKALPESASIKLTENRKKKIVILVTKEDHCLGDLLIRHEYGRLKAEIIAVIGNYETLQPLVEKFSIPFHCIPNENKTRQQHESEILSVIEQYDPEYIILAKYMRILTSDFIAHYPGRIINIHHSFLPAFIGARPYKQAYDRGVKIIGATAHFATACLDEGPIIKQAVQPVNHSQSADDMQQEGRDIENIVLAKALRLVFEDRIFITGNKTIIFD